MGIVRWIGPVPEKCDICEEPLTEVFVDGWTKYGPWACMCIVCPVNGPGINKLGPGVGQKFERQGDGKWMKTAG